MKLASRALRRVDVVSVHGRIDGEGVSEFEGVLRGLVERSRRKIVLDLRETEFINSGALRAMVSALKECKRSSGNLVIACANERVNDTLRLVGFSTLFEQYADVIDAIDSFE